MTEYVTVSDSVTLAYDDGGEGRPLVLIHGFAASRKITWSNTNWYQTLARAGYRVIALDCRGHGESEKPHEPADYDEGRMAADVMAILASLGVACADVMGYSMGGILAIRLMHEAPGRVRRAVVAGVGETYFQPPNGRQEIIAEGLLAKDASAVTDPVALEFRSFAERAGNDLAALAACIRRPRRIFEPDALQALAQPVLVVCGEADTMSGRPEPLANAFAHGQAVVVPGRNHHMTVGDRMYKDAVIGFLAAD
jgi:pimeloyl-ACP methyl ester carboxylesterase